MLHVHSKLATFNDVINKFISGLIFVIFTRFNQRTTHFSVSPSAKATVSRNMFCDASPVPGASVHPLQLSSKPISGYVSTYTTYV